MLWRGFEHQLGSWARWELEFIASLHLYHHSSVIHWNLGFFAGMKLSASIFVAICKTFYHVGNKNKFLPDLLRAIKLLGRCRSVWNFKRICQLGLWLTSHQWNQGWKENEGGAKPINSLHKVNNLLKSTWPIETIFPND